jgi:hypothetical protein
MNANLLMKTDIDLKKYAKNNQIIEHLKPREALFGGRTVAFKLYHKIEKGEKSSL